MTGLTWQIGDVEIQQIVELPAGEIIQDVVKQATPETVREIPWLVPNFADQNGKLKALVQCFLIKSGGKNILIDTCNGNDKTRNDIAVWGNLHTDFLKQLESDINIVACTHLHMDHVGWNTRLESGRWVPTLPKAKYLFAKKEYEYWASSPTKELADDKAAFVDSVKPIIDAGLAELVESSHRINDEISLIPTPGHTPSHVSVVIESKGEKAIISGDFIHHPIQIAHPEWVISSDANSAQAVTTRQQILDKIANTETLLLGSHFANPVAGKVTRSGELLRFYSATTIS